MKKILFAAVFMLAAFAVKAQNITQEQLQGKWKLVSLISESYSLDISKGTYQIADAAKKRFTKSEIETMESDMEIMLEMSAGITIEFKGTTVTFEQQGGDDTYVKKGSYTLEGALLTIKEEGEPDDVYNVLFKDGKLVLTDSDDMDSVFIKVK